MEAESESGTTPPGFVRGQSALLLGDWEREDEVGVASSIGCSIQALNMSFMLHSENGTC